MAVENYTECEFQVNKPNGDIDFVTVYDMPTQLAEKFVKGKYPDCKIECIVPCRIINPQ